MSMDTSPVETDEEYEVPAGHSMVDTAVAEPPAQSSTDPFDVGPSGEREVRTIELLRYFDRERRGAVVNMLIVNELQRRGLVMVPSIGEADYYGSVRIARAGSKVHHDLTAGEPGRRRTGDDDGEPGLRGTILSSLKHDGEELDYLTYDNTIPEAVELMRNSGHKKLPLFFDHDDRTSLIGTVTAKDLAFAATAPEGTRLVSLAKAKVPVVSTRDQLSDWIPAILEYGFIYGRDRDQNIVQIYTTYDLATHMNALAQMFLRVQELEELLRDTLSRVPEAELRGAKDRVRGLEMIRRVDGSRLLQPSDIQPAGDAGEDRYVDTLTFADYLKVLSSDDIWRRCFDDSARGRLDRDKCLRSINDARIARNRVMHLGRQEELDSLAPSLECLAVWLRKS